MEKYPFKLVYKGNDTQITMEAEDFASLRGLFETYAEAIVGEDVVTLDGEDFDDLYDRAFGIEGDDFEDVSEEELLIEELYEAVEEFASLDSEPRVGDIVRYDSNGIYAYKLNDMYGEVIEPSIDYDGDWVLVKWFGGIDGHGPNGDMWFVPSEDVLVVWRQDA